MIVTQIATAETSNKVEFHYTIYIAKPVKEVWSAITEKQSVDQYYMAPVLKLELKPGGAISYGGKSPVIEGIVKEVEPSKKLVHTFHFVGSKDPDSTVTYELKAIGDSMCVLDLTHEGFSGPNQTYADITGGWPVILSSLKTFLETGKKMPWPKN